MCQRAMDALRTTPPATYEETALLGTTVGVLGWFMFRCGHTTEGTTLLAESMVVLRTVDEPLLLLFTVTQNAYIAAINGDVAQAVAWHDEMIVLARRVGSPWVFAQTYFQRALLYAEHKPETAYEILQEGMPFIRTADDRYVLSLSLFFFGQTALSLGNVNEAEAYFSESLEHSIAIQNGVGEITALHGLAKVACAREAWRDAITYSLEALTRSREVGDQWSRAKTLVTLGAAEAGQGNRVAARRSFIEAVTVSLAARVLPAAIEAWLGLVDLDVEGGERSMSVLTILALVRDHPATSRVTAARAASLWGTLVPQVGENARTSAQQVASRLAPDQLSALLTAYVEGRATALIDTLMLQRT